MRRGRLLIVGAGGHGKVVGECAEAAGGWSSLAFFDDEWPTLSHCGPWPVLGRCGEAMKSIQADDQLFVAIGNCEARLQRVRALEAAGIDVAVLVHPRAVVSSRAELGRGTLVVAGAVINIGASLGAACIVNTGATIDHDCRLADGVHVCPGAHLAGNVHVGESSWIGIGCAVVQGRRIGERVVVGAGAVVIDDVADGLTVVGVPAAPLIK